MIDNETEFGKWAYLVYNVYVLIIEKLFGILFKSIPSSYYLLGWIFQIPIHSPQRSFTKFSGTQQSTKIPIISIEIYCFRAGMILKNPWQHQGVD